MPDLSADQVATATGANQAPVEAHWPLILEALREFGMASFLVQVAAAATVAVETGSFNPIQERMADPAKQPDLYKCQLRYSPYLGRGFVQITWEYNYRAAGEALGIDLIGHPEMALEPETAARVLAWFFSRNGIQAAAEARDWRRVRKAVNGGYNGWDRFKKIVDRLLPFESA